VQTVALLHEVDGRLEHRVDLLILEAAPLALDPARRGVAPVHHGAAAPGDPLAPRLDPHDLLHQGPELLPLEDHAADRLDALRGVLALLLPEVAPGVLQAEQGLDVVGEEADRLVHLHLDLPPPVGLDERRALDDELQTGELDALVGAQLEEDHALPDGPGGAVLRLRDAQLRGQVLEQLLRPELRVVQVLQA